MRKKILTIGIGLFLLVIIFYIAFRFYFYDQNDRLGLKYPDFNTIIITFVGPSGGLGYQPESVNNITIIGTPRNGGMIWEGIIPKQQVSEISPDDFKKLVEKFY